MGARSTKLGYPTMVTRAKKFQSETYIDRCREDLATLYARITTHQKHSRYFLAKLYTFFFGINLGCYWLGILVLFPHSLAAQHLDHYAKISIPVGVLEASFDFFSFFLTL